MFLTLHPVGHARFFFTNQYTVKNQNKCAQKYVSWCIKKSSVV